MEQKTRFDQVFNDELLPKLKEIEPIRVKASKVLKWLVRLTFLLFILSLIFLIKDGVSHNFITALISTIFIGFGSLVIFKSQANDYFPFEDKFKEYIIPKLVSLIADDLKYRPLQHISKERVLASKLLIEDFHINGSNSIAGTYYETGVMLSYLKVDSTREYGSNLFQGIFFVADFYKEFNGSVILLPNLVKQNKPSFSIKMMQKGRSEEYIHLEDSEFAESYICLASDEILARYILSFSFKEKLLKYKQLHPNHFIYFSFVNGSIYVAIDSKRNPFSPRIHVSLLDKRIIQSIYEELLLVFELVEILELN